MKFVFLDEQEGQGPQGKYTAVVAGIFDDRNINEFRHNFIRLMLDRLKLDPGENENRKINRIPLIHGSDFLPEYSDDIKLGALSDLVSLSSRFDLKFIRIGYYDKSLFFADPNYQIRINNVLANLNLSLCNYFSENFAYVYELNEAFLKGRNHRPGYNDDFTVEIAAQIPFENLSVDVVNNIGHFYCEKRNHCMYIVDVIGYLLKKVHDFEFMDNPKSDYQNSLFDLGKSLSGRVLSNELIYYNEKEKCSKSSFL